MATWIRAAKGVRYKEHPTRKHNSRPDRYFEIQYKRGGKVTNEVMGWESEGMTRAKCERILSTLRENWRTGTGGQSYKEIRELNLEAQATKKEEKQKAASLTLPGIFFDGYLAYTKGTGKQETGIKNEIGLMNNHLAPFFGDASIYKIDVRKMDAFVDYLNNVISERTKRPLSAQTKKHALNLVSQIFSYAQSRIDNTIQSPVRHITKPSTVSEKRERFLTRDEAVTLLAALKARSQMTHDMAMLALFCGMRAGEILALTWGCINFEEKSLCLKDTKNGETRHAYMTPEIETMLRNRHDGQALDVRLFRGAEISSTFERVVRDIGLNDGRTDRRDRVVFHTLRHTFASWHAQRGTPLYTIGKLLGHKTLAMTQRYAHLCPSAERQAVMALHGALDEPKAATIVRFKASEV